MSELTIKYQIITSEEDAEALARKIAIEQSVETPETLISADIEEKYVGKSELSKVKDGIYILALTYHEDVLSGQYNQLLNLSFGNVAMYPNVRLADISLPDSCLSSFQGPLFGIDGIRKLLNVHDRPLLATALKPRGYSDQQFADLAYEFALGGGDIIKDDQNLIGSFDEFKNRVTSCHQAIERANDKTGKRCFYFPHISAPYEALSKYFDFIKELDIKGVLLAPSVMGLDTARGWASTYNLIYMAHPTFTGSYCVPPNHGMDYHLFYGLLYRLAGVDISVYPNTGGRFMFTETDCKHIAQELTRPMDRIAKAFPCPAGGMQFEHLARMCEWYGKDAVFLLGGSLLEYSDSLANSTRAFLQQISESTRENTDIKPTTFTSSCEIPVYVNQQQQEFLRFDQFNWEGRESVQYKQLDDIAYKGVRRIELIGKQGEDLDFDLRYFEIEQGGFSSLEKHQHTHVIIVVRGQGEVLVDDEVYTANTNDIVYIRPMKAHQLKNREREPFGFYCIVDHQRDQPVSVAHD